MVRWPSPQQYRTFDDDSWSRDEYLVLGQLQIRVHAVHKPRTVGDSMLPMARLRFALGLKNRP